MIVNLTPDTDDFLLNDIATILGVKWGVHFTHGTPGRWHGGVTLTADVDPSLGIVYGDTKLECLLQYLKFKNPPKKRKCPKLRGRGPEAVSQYICRHHDLDGIVIDEPAMPSGE